MMNKPALQSIGINGIATSVKIMALRSTPKGDERDKDVALSIIYAVDNGADIINMSFSKDFSPQKEFVDIAVRYAEEHGVLLVHGSGNKGQNLDDNERSKEKIIEDIIDKLTKLQKECAISSIHLNYTGGTKPMAVYAYSGVIDFCKMEKNKTIRSFFSYLDPKEFKLVLDESGTGYPAEPDRDLRYKVKLGIEDLFDIHLMKYEKKGDFATFNNNDLEIAKISKEILDSFNKGKPVWPEKFFDLKDKTRKKKLNINGIKKLNEENAFKGINKNIPSLKNFFKKDKFDLEKESPKKRFAELIKFMSGIWLEDFIVDIIKGLKEKNKIVYDEIRKSVHATYNKKRPLEVDIIVMKGYQMFLFSCTADDNTENVKSKAFEAVFRAEQLGGDHATAVTVSHIEDIDPVDKDLKTFGDLQGRYKLIGRDKLMDIEELKKELTLIIRK